MDGSDEPKTLSEVVRRCVSLICANLPDEWLAEAGSEVPTGAGVAADAIVRITSPDGVQATLVLEAKRLIERRDVSSVITQLRTATDPFQNVTGVVAARYLTPSVREMLTERGVSYADATGNEFLTVSRPGILVMQSGADKDPWRRPGRPRGTLKGAPAARVVRALVDIPGPWRIRELIEASGASTGATYRVVGFLEREGLLFRDEAGSLNLGSWRQLVQEWGKDYGFVRSNRITSYIEPRGLPALLQKVAAAGDLEYAVTGSLAASEWAAYAPARAAQIYVADAAKAAQRWGLRPAESGSNVLLAEPEAGFVFDRSRTNRDGIVVVAPAQAAVDLLTGPGRNPSEAEELMDWMERNELSWRQ